MVVQSQFIEQFSDERWPLKSISELCDIVTDGEHQTPRRVDSGIYLLSARNVKNQELSFDEVDYIDEQEYQRIAKRIEPQENDVLISCSGSVGRTCVVPKGIRFQLVRSVALLRFKPVVDPLFMSYQMAMPYVQSQIETLKSQTSQANLFQGNIKKIQVIVPSKEEQKRFIIVVRKADKSKFDGLKSQFIELVQRCNPEKKTLESICTRGPQNGFYRKGAEIDGTIPIVKMSQLFGFESMSDVSHFDLVSMTEDEIRRFSLTENDLLFGRRSLVPEGAGKCRRAGKIDKTVVFESSILRVSIDPAICYPRFIQAWTESPEGEQSISELRAGTSVVGITGSGLSKVMIPVPTKSVQDVFIGVAEQADKSKYLS